MTSFGDGVYKSTDAGQTWKNIGLQKSRHIADVVVHRPDLGGVWCAGHGRLEVVDHVREVLDGLEQLLRERLTKIVEGEVIDRTVPQRALEMDIEDITGKEPNAD